MRCFGIKVNESQVIPIAGTVPPSRCEHCRTCDGIMLERTCMKDRWKCKCPQCKEFRSEWRKGCDTGTDPTGIVKAARHFGVGLTIVEYASEDKNHAWQWLHGSLIHGRVSILCIDSWDHWALAAASLGDRVLIIDPGNAKKNLDENGVHPLTRDELMSRWWNARQWVGREQRLYAISIGRNK